MLVQLTVPNAEDIADSSSARRANPGGRVFDHYASFYRDVQKTYRDVQKTRSGRIALGVGACRD